MNWIEIPGGKYTLLSGKDKKSQCQIELNVRYDDSCELVKSELTFSLGGTNSYRTHPKANGLRLPLCVS